MKFSTFLFAAMFFIVMTSRAQTSLGLRGGYVNAGLGSGNNAARGTDRIDSWQAGFYTNTPLFNRGYLQSGISYIVKGAELDYNVPPPANLFASGATRLKLQYLQLPVNFVYKQPVGIGKLIVGAGPYVAYCVRGDYNVSAYSDGKLVQTGSQRVNFGSSPNIFGTGMRMQRWDAGLNFVAGVELNCFLTLTAHYDYGLMDVDKSPGNELKNRYWGVSLGVLFDREDW
ncbi:outer membrane beta-barrel protein [Chitinophaga sp. 22321]|uniref:Outer membrane beta-barrel protein n=1 Tax=Chitinophaga hostae TaxID=2831022 RepID=A0ABS5ITQ0_9BACT|nr:outer membrane beta-barrel protein [Chitinophaga hostae]MBS0025742.1 outer membrane beta-barrel protein [Chitinophaga hostae]